MKDLYWILYIISMVYCFWKMVKRYNHASLDGVIGPTPGLDILVVLFLSPILAVADIIVTTVKWIRKKKIQKQNA